MNNTVGSATKYSKGLRPLAPADAHAKVGTAIAQMGQIPIPKSDYFPAGVMAGDAEPKRAVLWTSYTGNLQLKIVLWYIEQKKNKEIRHLESHATARLQFTPLPASNTQVVHVDVEGLLPGSLYEYEFHEYHNKFTNELATGRSPTGRFRTAIADKSLKPVAFGGTSCTAQHGRRRPITNLNLKNAAKHSNLSFFLHAGDQVYCDYPNSKKTITNGPASTSDQYHDKYMESFSQPGPKGLHAAFAMYTTWDDHEIFDRWQGTRNSPQERDGISAFFEHQPIGEFDVTNSIQANYSPPKSCKCDLSAAYNPAKRRSRSDKNLWWNFRWGRTLELFVLDCRSERQSDKYISDDQKNWLIQGIHKSPAVFKFILNSSPIGIFPDYKHTKLQRKISHKQTHLLKSLKGEHQLPRRQVTKLEQLVKKLEQLAKSKLKTLEHELLLEQKKSLLGDLIKERTKLISYLQELQPQHRLELNNIRNNLDNQKNLTKKLPQTQGQRVAQLPTKIEGQLQRLVKEENRLLKQLPQHLQLQRYLQLHKHIIQQQQILLPKKQKKNRPMGKPDRHWASFPAQREQILSAAQCVGGVWWLSGDFHYGSVGGVGLSQGSTPTSATGRPSSDYSNVGEILMGPGGNWNAKPWKRSEEARSKRRRIRSFAKLWKDRWSFSTPESNYVVIRVDVKPKRSASTIPDKNKSTVQIQFFHGRRLLHSEKRSYNMEILKTV